MAFVLRTPVVMVDLEHKGDLLAAVRSGYGGGGGSGGIDVTDCGGG
jgi:hypothetical protein